MSTLVINFDERAVRSAGYSHEPSLKFTSNVSSYCKPLIKTTMDIKTFDTARVTEIDNFYKIVQLHREQYKDSTGTNHPLKYFKTNDNGSPNKLYLCKYPVTYVKYRAPPVFPKTHARAIRIPSLPERSIRGTYNHSPCTAWKF